MRGGGASKSFHDTLGNNVLLVYSVKSLGAANGELKCSQP